jgi:hypothetical protein
VLIDHCRLHEKLVERAAGHLTWIGILPNFKHFRYDDRNHGYTQLKVANRTQRTKEEEMNSRVKPIPDGFHTLTPHLVVKGASQAIEFYKKAFGAEEISRAAGPDGKSLMHADLRIGDSRLFLVDEFP